LGPIPIPNPQSPKNSSDFYARKFNNKSTFITLFIKIII
jgi:hypothetical protein